MSARASSCGRTEAQALSGSLMHSIMEPGLRVPADCLLMPVIINGEGEERIFEALPLLQWLEAHPGFSPIGYNDPNRRHYLPHDVRNKGLVVAHNRDDPKGLVRAQIAERLLRARGYNVSLHYYNAAGETYYGVVTQYPPPPPQAPPRPQPQARTLPVVASFRETVPIVVPVGVDLGTLAGGAFVAQAERENPGKHLVFRLPPPPHLSAGRRRQIAAEVL